MILQSILFNNQHYNNSMIEHYLFKHGLKPIKKLHQMAKYTHARFALPNPSMKYITVQKSQYVKYVYMY